MSPDSLHSFFASPDTPSLCLSVLQAVKVELPSSDCPLIHLSPFANADIVGVVEATVNVNNPDDAIMANNAIDLDFIDNIKNGQILLVLTMSGLSEQFIDSKYVSNMSPCYNILQPSPKYSIISLRDLHPG